MMTAHDVVVVGGGLGGLTVAALLAARGVDVCLLERQSFVGGCATPIQKLDYTFDPTFALDSLWEPGQLHQRIFAELPASPPETKVLSPSYAVRLPDATNVIVAPDEQQFLHAIANFFPECASAALSFYQRAAELSDALSHAAERFPHLASLSRLEKARLLIAEPRLSRASATYLTKAVASDLNAIGHRFKCFIDSQLLSFAGVPSERCSWGRAALTLTIARRSAYAVKGRRSRSLQRSA
ncbi:MAG: FAD-dependent oxidoreductase [Pyrinomonadaceae bacterium]